jgi:hypothetical protein
MLGFLLKRGVYDKIINSSDVLALIQMRELKKVILGSALLIGFRHGGDYVIANH